MTEGEQIGRNIAEWFHSNPRRAKVVAWLMVAAVILACIFMAIDIIRHGKWLKALFVFSIAGIGVWKALRSRSARQGNIANSGEQ